MPSTPTVALRYRRVRELRDGLGLTRLELAQRIGYSSDLIKLIEKGRPPSKTVAWWLARALGVPPEDITVGGVPVPVPVDNPAHTARVREPALSP
jgi:transcriptional regulator with XRE-family HTH domain